MSIILPTVPSYVFYVIFLTLVFALFDVYNNKQIPFYLVVPFFIAGLFVSSNLALGLIMLSICLATAPFISKLGLGMADSIEIGLIALVFPLKRLLIYQGHILTYIYTLPTIALLWVLSLAIGTVLTFLFYRKGGQPLAISILLAVVLVLLI